MVLFRLNHLGVGAVRKCAASSRLERNQLGELDGTDPQPLRQGIFKPWYVPAEEIFYVRGIIERDNYAGSPEFDGRQWMARCTAYFHRASPLELACRTHSKDREGHGRDPGKAPVVDRSGRDSA